MVKLSVLYLYLGLEDERLLLEVVKVLCGYHMMRSSSDPPQSEAPS